MVSPFCHLTGALGAALELHDHPPADTKFRGFDLYKKNIPVSSETCEICTNHCKLKVTEIDGTIEAYGFLCGRDYHGKQFVKNQSSAFQLMNKRKEIFAFKPAAKSKSITVGIPAGLHLFDEIPFWQRFFDYFAISAITSENYKSVVKDGKNISSAEFCAPIAAMHGHVDHLLKKADYIFLPVYFAENGDASSSKQYCYYTQFVASVISVHKQFRSVKKILSPILKSQKGELYVRLELLRMLKSIGVKDIGLLQVTLAYNKAKKLVNNINAEWQAVYKNEIRDDSDIHVMLLDALTLCCRPP